MIDFETDTIVKDVVFDVAIVAVGFERRCRWVVGQYKIKSNIKIGLEFGYLKEGSYIENKIFFENLGYSIELGVGDNVESMIIEKILRYSPGKRRIRVFLDISSMSREMIANVVLALGSVSRRRLIEVSVAYSPSKFMGDYRPAPIRSASPIKSSLAGWSSSPERPVGALFGLGCEPGLALGALQVLEPAKAWVFAPQGVDQQFDRALSEANSHLSDIFDITKFEYNIQSPALARKKIEILINSIENNFRVIVVPFGPKIFAWISLSTVVFGGFENTGIWAFSSKEQAQLVDRSAEGPVIWHTVLVNQSNIEA